jgi:hypothetical protein
MQEQQVLVIWRHSLQSSGVPPSSSVGLRMISPQSIVPHAAPRIASTRSRTGRARNRARRDHQACLP